MNSERLWAPWRLTYVSGEKHETETQPAPALPPGADPDCFICRAVAADDDRRFLVARRGPRSITILNRYPYNNGHLLVAPRSHKARLEELDDDEHVELMRTIAQLVNGLESLLRAEGFNIGLNLGRVAGAGLPGHLHWHLVPRWHGDTNFMPALAGVKVIPQSLEALWELLHGAWSADSS